MPSRKAFLDVILSKEGCPYIWAAKGPDRFDCSGLVTWGLWEVGGPDLRKFYNCQKLWGIFNEIEAPQPGDLCFYGSSPKHVTHVMVYIGPQRVFGASGGGSQTLTPAPYAKVQFKKAVNYRPDFLGYRKLPF